MTPRIAQLFASLQDGATQRQLQMLSTADLDRLVAPGPGRAEYLKQQAARKVCDNQHEAQRPCRIRR